MPRLAPPTSAALPSSPVSMAVSWRSRELGARSREIAAWDNAERTFNAERWLEDHHQANLLRGDPAYSSLSLLRLRCSRGIFNRQRSERSLVTWPAFETCAKVGASHERLDRQTVAARSTQQYFRTFAPWTDNVKCVVVTTEDGGLLRAEEYKYGTTYVIDESAAPRGPVSMGQEYDDSLWSAAAKGSVSAILTLAIPFALIGGMAVIGGVLGIRSATRYRRRKKTL